MNNPKENPQTDSHEWVYDKIRTFLDSPAPDMNELKPALDEVTANHGPQAAYNVLMRWETAKGLRKPTMAIFDHTGHIIGGGQKYGFTVANALQDIFDITLVLCRPTTHENIADWYELDLSKCKIKIIDIPFFDQFDDKVHLDPFRVSYRTGNPFHAISKESGNYDFFINNSMNEKVFPLANCSYMICHFPERRPRDYFYADRCKVIYNSKYTAGWIEKKWKFTPHKHIFPPVDMAPEEGERAIDISAKENMILSVARFEAGGSKKQWEMVQTFMKLNRRYGSLFKDWTLVLAGGSAGDNPYLKRIEKAVEENKKGGGTDNIKLKVNIRGDELKTLYKKSSIFWHLCGLDQTDPALVEHFGMTIAESMQNKVAPVVFDGGGQREIVEQGVTGFRVASTAELMKYTSQLARDNDLRKTLAINAEKRSREFERNTFEQKVKDYFNEELNEYTK